MGRPMNFAFPLFIFHYYSTRILKNKLKNPEEKVFSIAFLPVDNFFYAAAYSKGMENIGFYNGEWGTLSELRLPVLDRAYYFGDGIYDAAYTRNKVIFALDEHVERFFSGLKKVGITIPYTPERVIQIMLEGVQKCDENDLFVYIQASCGTGIRNHADRRKTGNFLLMVYPKKIAPPQKTLTVLTTADRRYDMCDVKTLSIIPNVLAAQEAEENGCDEAILVRNGEVTECAHSNVHILVGGVLLSPPPCFCTLGGIGRKHLLSACKELSVPVVARRFSPAELSDADEIIITSAGYPCQRVTTCDGKKCGGKDEETFSALSQWVYDELYLTTEK